MGKVYDYEAVGEIKRIMSNTWAIPIGIAHFLK